LQERRIISSPYGLTLLSGSPESRLEEEKLVVNKLEKGRNHRKGRVGAGRWSVAPRLAERKDVNTFEKDPGNQHHGKSNNFWIHPLPSFRAGYLL
jgi:hypothetical protein